MKAGGRKQFKNKKLGSIRFFFVKMAMYYFVFLSKTVVLSAFTTPIARAAAARCISSTQSKQNER